MNIRRAWCQSLGSPARRPSPRRRRSVACAGEQLERRAMLTTVIATLPAESIGLRSATIGAELIEAANPTNVALYWGDEDGGEAAASWDHSTSFGTVPVGQVRIQLDDLTTNQEYFYRALGFNFTDGIEWTDVASFRTLPPDLASMQSDPIGFVNATTVEVSGRVTDTGGDTPTVAAYFGEQDGQQDPAAWQQRVALGQFDGEFAALLSGLSPGTSYFLRFAAENGKGVAWDAPTYQLQTPAAPPLQITEWMAANSSVAETRVRLDTEARFVVGTDRAYDWLEIQNNTNVDRNLGGYHLTDNDRRPMKWAFPADTIIPAGGTLLVYASGLDLTDPAQDDNESLHTNFRLSRNGEYIAITDPNGSVIHAVDDYPAQIDDASYGFFGGVVGLIREPTPGEPNRPIGPEVRYATHEWENDDPTQAWTVTTEVVERMAPITAIQLHYRVMFDDEVTVDMVDDGTQGDAMAGDGIYTGVIPAGIAAPGQMLRYRVSATDTLDLQGRHPVFPSENHSPEYHGTMIADPSVNSALPVLYRFVEDQRNVDSSRGTRASVSYAGQFYDNVFIRIRGGTARNWPKKAYKIEFNDGYHFQFDANVPRVDEINVNTTYTDKSYLRAAMTSIFQNDVGTPSPETFLLRMHENGEFHSVGIFVEQPDRDFLRRHGLDPEGSLYKGGPGSSLVNRGGLEKKTRETEDRSDVEELIASLKLTGDDLENYLFDNIDIPAMVNFMATVVITQNIDASDKNYYLYRDTEGTGEWEMLPWDLDLTFGPDALNTDLILADDDVRGARNPNAVHPHLGARAVTLDSGAKFNEIQDRIINDPRTREMFHRRIRTLADEYLGTSYFYDLIDDLVMPLGDQVAEDRAEWRNSAHFNPRVLPSHADEVQRIKDEYLARRYPYLTEFHVQGGVGLPTAQPENIELRFGDVQAASDTAIADQEYFIIENPHDFAVDVSGWQLVGALRDSFEPGTVIPANGVLYMAADVAAFRARATGPSGNQALFVQQYDGNLSDVRGTISINDRQGNVVATTVYGGDLNSDGMIDEGDIATICSAIGGNVFDFAFDLNGDRRLDQADLSLFVAGALGSTIGDVNLDGQFDSTDLALVFSAGEYEDGVAGNSSWSDGDWNCDGEFDSRDLVLAFQASDYVPVAAAPAARNTDALAPGLFAAAVDQLFDSDRKA